MGEVRSCLSSPIPPVILNEIQETVGKLIVSLPVAYTKLIVISLYAMRHFTSSERNKDILNYNGYQYSFKRKGAQTNEWRCRQRTCSSTLTLSLDNGIVIRAPSIHSCERVNASKQIIDGAIQRMKKRAREETTTIPKIYTEELVRTRIANPGMVTGFSYPELNSIDSALYRQRALNFPRLPTDLLNFQLPYEWTLGVYAEPFLLVDEVYGPNNKERLLMFGTDWSLSFLSTCSRWHSDGTFDIRPLLFEQVYIVCGFNEGFMIPCIYTLTTKKDEITYTNIFRHIVTLGSIRQGVTMKPIHLTCDFELSAIKAFTNIFPDACVKTCFFHYSQNLWKKIQECSLSSYFIGSNENNETNEQHNTIRKWFNGALGLALIPPSLIQNTWVELMDHFTPDLPGGTAFNDYLVSYYVDFSSARFTQDSWNFYYEIIQRLPRTNNHVEGFNRRINSIFPIHPHIFNFIQCLRHEHEFQHHPAEESLFTARKWKKISENIDSMLEFHLQEYKNGNLTSMELAIKCGEAVKIKHVTK